MQTERMSLDYILTLTDKSSSSIYIDFGASNVVLSSDGSMHKVDPAPSTTK
jgi:hypothetical protein